MEVRAKKRKFSDKEGPSGSISGVSQPTDTALPSLDEGILQEVRQLGRYPVDMNDPKTDAQ